MNGIIGQQRALDTLQAQLDSQRLHHAYIFHGPAGVGKFRTALAFAQVLLCPQRQPNLAGQVEACGSCTSCQHFAPASTSARDEGADDDAGQSPDGTRHPDCHIVRKELARFSSDASIRDRKLLTIPVQVLREALIEPVYRRPTLHGGKVFIIDEAQLLPEAAQNILLKTLEEPPADTRIILVTPSEDALLTTIRSRCQRVGFTTIAPQDAAQWISQHYPEIDEPTVNWVNRFAEGSFGRIQLALEYNLRAWHEAVSPAVDGMKRAHFPVGLGEHLASFIDGFATRWVSENDNASKDAANKQGTGLMLTVFAQIFRHQLHHAARLVEDPTDANAALTPWLTAIDALSHAERELHANVRIALVMDHLLARIQSALQSAR